MVDLHVGHFNSITLIPTPPAWGTVSYAAIRVSYTKNMF